MSKAMDSVHSAFAHKLENRLIAPCPYRLQGLSGLKTQAWIAVFAMALASAASASGTPGTVPASPASYPAEHTSPAEYTATPASKELIDRAIARLDQVVGDVLARSGVPGMAVAVVHGTETVFAKGYGVRRVDSDLAIDADTVFLLASLSKPIGATVVATQVSRNLVTWETPVVDHLPQFRLSDPWVSQHVTIGDFYSHRSGLPDHAGDDLEDLGYGRQEIFDRLRLIRLEPFRAHYAYTNFGITVAAQAVAQAAGTDWATLSRQNLYEPLGMESTSSSHADYLSRSNRASGHIPGPDGSGYLVSDLRQPDTQSPAGGVSSSARDVARWMSMVLQNGRYQNKAIIDGDALRAAITPKMITGQPHSASARAGSYGYGFNVSVQPSGRVMLSHSGAFYLGAGTTFAMIPSLNLGIVVLTNASPVGAAEAVSASFMDMAQLGHVTRDWFAAYQPLMVSMTSPIGALAGKKQVAKPSSAQALQTYTGIYRNDYFGPIDIQDRNGELSLLIGPDQMLESLKHWDGNTFTFMPFNENAPRGSISKVQFEDISQGKAQRVIIEHLDKDGMGTFVR